MSDVVTIGDCTLYHGDCLDILPTLPKVDAVITDPPYGIGFAAQPTRCQRANGMVAADWDNARPSDDAMQMVVAAGDVAIVWGGNYFRLPPSRGWLIWVKSGNAPSMADAEMAWTSRDMNTRVMRKSVKSASIEKCLRTNPHPTQKPVDLMAWSAEFAPGHVLDPFMGSGTTGVACAQLGRKFIGIEIERKYFDIACERIDNAYRQQRLFA